MCGLSRDRVDGSKSGSTRRQRRERSQVFKRAKPRSRVHHWRRHRRDGVGRRVAAPRHSVYDIRERRRVQSEEARVRVNHAEVFGASALKQLGLELNGVGSDANVALHSNGKVLGEYGHSVEKRKERTANDASAANSNSKHLPSVAHSLRNVHIPRQELRKMLLDAVNPENIRWGMKFDSAKTILEDGENNDDPRVEVTFTNGEKILSDCVVGADGLFSR